MMRNRVGITSAAFTSSLMLVACGGGSSAKPDKPNKPIQTRSELINEGSVCVSVKQQGQLRVLYFPLDTACASSSLNRWEKKHLDISAEPQRNSVDSALHINTSVVHVKSNSMIATSDCAGAGIQSKTMNFPSHKGFDVYWDKHRLGQIPNTEGAVLCKRLDKQGRISSASQLYDYVKMTDRFNSHRSR